MKEMHSIKKTSCVLLFLLATLVTSLFSVGVAGAANGVVNINVASAKELSKSLNGIGLKKAEAIVAYRKMNGNFSKVKDLLKIKGIGPKILLKNEALIRIASDN